MATGDRIKDNTRGSTAYNQFSLCRWGIVKLKLDKRNLTSYDKTLIPVFINLSKTFIGRVQRVKLIFPEWVTKI